MASSELQSPRLPLAFKFSEPALGVDPLVHMRKEQELMIEYFIDHILGLRQEIEELNNRVNDLT